VPDTDLLLTVLHPVVAAYSEASRNLWVLGYLKRSVEYAERAVEIGRRIGHPDSLAFAWLFRGWNHAFRRDWAQCLSSVEAGIAVASDSGSVQTLAWNRCVKGWALAHTGRIAEGIEEFSHGIALSRRIMGQVAIPQFSAMMAEMLLLRVDVDEAQKWLSQALDLSNRQFDRYFDAELHRLSAICLMKRRQPEAARAQLQKALEGARTQDAATFELRAALTLAAIDLQEARTIVGSVLAKYPEPESWPDIQEAQHLAP
jgi:predicted ATPase